MYIVIVNAQTLITVASDTDVNSASCTVAPRLDESRLMSASLCGGGQAYTHRHSSMNPSQPTMTAMIYMSTRRWNVMCWFVQKYSTYCEVFDFTSKFGWKKHTFLIYEYHWIIVFAICSEVPVIQYRQWNQFRDCPFVTVVYFINCDTKN